VPIYRQRVEAIKYLTPGDYATIYRQSKFSRIKDGNDLIKRLIEEVEVKNDIDINPMGFV
jgi:hypothetical protein